MQTKAFFGTEGLTSTSANHIANLAKEANREHQNYLASIQFYSERIGIIGTPERVFAQEGVNLEGLSKVKTAIESIAENNAQEMPEVLHEIAAMFSYYWTGEEWCLTYECLPEDGRYVIRVGDERIK